MCHLGVLTRHVSSACSYYYTVDVDRVLVWFVVVIGVVVGGCVVVVVIGIDDDVVAVGSRLVCG